jgi:hypothetical protein
MLPINGITYNAPVNANKSFTLSNLPSQKGKHIHGNWHFLIKPETSLLSVLTPAAILSKSPQDPTTSKTTPPHHAPPSSNKTI